MISQTITSLWSVNEIGTIEHDHYLVVGDV